MKLGVRFTLLLFGTGLIALLIAGGLEQSRLQKHFARKFSKEAASVADELSQEAPLLLHPANRSTLPYVLEVNRKRLGAKSLTFFDARGRAMAQSHDNKTKGGLGQSYTRNVHQGSVLLGRLVIERGSPDELVRALTKVTLGTLFITLFIAWLLAEAALQIAVTNPLHRLMTKLRKVAAGRLAIDDLKDSGKGDELATIGTMVASIIEEEQKQAAKVHHLPLTNRQVSAGTRN